MARVEHPAALASLDEPLRRALVTSLVDARAIDDGTARTGDPPRIAVAYSGGIDSTALLDVASRLHGEGLVAITAMHVHHGLQAGADAWLEHCAAQADARGVPFAFERVSLARHSASLEAEARRVRYAALVRMCETRGCRWLLTAHHADDQAETVLLHLARGTGIGGLAATARARRIGDVLVLRPFLGERSAALRRHVEDAGLPYVVDPSNEDRRFTRNAIRHEVMPALRRIAPTVATHLARTAAHAATVQSLLDEIGREDLGVDDAAIGAELDVERLASLSRARASNALRTWLAGRGMRAPTAAALNEMLDQLVHAKPDAQIALLHERRTLRLYRGRVSIEGRATSPPSLEPIAWHGEASIAVPSWHGRLRFVPADECGFDAQALRSQPLSLRPRQGGERMRSRRDGPSRTLKNLYQEAGIAAWRRRRLPLVYHGQQLLHAAGLGPNHAAMVERTPGVDLVTLEWESDDAPR